MNVFWSVVYEGNTRNKAKREAKKVSAKSVKLSIQEEKYSQTINILHDTNI